MATLKVKVIMAKGREGIPLDKLANITEETLRFLNHVCDDLKVDEKKGKWIGTKFSSEYSLVFDCEREIEDADTVRMGNKLLEAICSRKENLSPVKISKATRIQYSRIASRIDSDESVDFGIYHNGNSEEPVFYELNKKIASIIERETASQSVYYGEIQGIIHSFYKETRRKKLILTELVSGNRVDCYFPDEMYHNMVELLDDEEGIFFIEGEVTEDMKEGIIKSIEVTDYRPAPRFDEKEFYAMIGTMPNITGDETTEDYIARLRDNASQESAKDLY